MNKFCDGVGTVKGKEQEGERGWDGGEEIAKEEKVWD